MIRMKEKKIGDWKRVYWKNKSEIIKMKLRIRINFVVNCKEKQTDFVWFPMNENYETVFDKSNNRNLFYFKKT
jgi:hypothetical protein